MRISGKLFTGFAIIIVFAIIVGIIGIAGMQRLRESELSMYEKQVIGIEYSGKAVSLFEQIRLDVRLVVINSLYDDIKGAFDIKMQFENNVAEFRELMEICRELAVPASAVQVSETTVELLNFYKRIMELFEDMYLPVGELIIEKSINDIPDHTGKLHINVMLSHIGEIADRITNLLYGMTELNVAIAKQTSISNAAVTQQFIVVQTLLLVLAAVFAFFTAIYIVKSIMAPINESADVLYKIAAGNFEARVTGKYFGEFAIIKKSVNSTAADIKTYMNFMSGIEYASKIQKNLLPPDSEFTEAFSDHYCIWKPKDIVGGDIYCMKSFPGGTVLCVCDCTGHGTPGALLTMLVVSAFETVVTAGNYNDTAQIIWELDKRLVSELNVTSAVKTKVTTKDTSLQGLNINDGCDLAVLFIAKDGSVTISAGNTNVFVCDGKKVTRLRGQRIRVGDGTLQSKEGINVTIIPSNPDNKFYIASDGLYEQPGGMERLPFGYDITEKIILENHIERQSVICDKIWQAFEKYRGINLRCDDFVLVSFKP